MHSALLNNDSIKLANEKIQLQKTILARTQTKLEESTAAAAAAGKINKKYAESTRLLAAARSQDAQAFKVFAKAFRRYMNEESSSDSLEREYRRMMAQVEVMLSNGVGDAAADKEVGTAFGSAAASPLVRPFGVTPQMESEWDEEEDDRPPSGDLFVSAIDLRSSPATTRPSTSVRDMTNSKSLRTTPLVRLLSPNTNVNASPIRPIPGVNQYAPGIVASPSVSRRLSFSP